MTRTINGTVAELRTEPPRPSEVHATKPLRVAMVLYKDDLHVGGSLRLVETLAHALDPKRAEVHLVFAYGGPGPVTSRSFVPCHFLQAQGPLDFQAWFRTRRLFAKLRPDLLHFHNPAYWIHAAVARAGYRKISHMHGPYF